MAAEDEVDHYAVLGLPSGDAGALLTLNQIEKAYRNESRKRHPDKRPDDPNATADFQLLTSSFHALRDPASRSALDSRLRSRRDRALRDAHHSAKRRRFTDDLNHRERAAEAAVDQAQRQEKEKMVASDIQKELAAFQARNFNKPTFTLSSRVDADAVPGLDTDKLLKVSWERDGGDGDYTAVRLRELFGRFGAVEDVVIQSSSKKKKKGSAVVAMSSKESASAAVHFMSGSLHVLPLRVAANYAAEYSEPSHPKVSNVFGVGLQDYEDSILKKLERAQQKQQGA